MGDSLLAAAFVSYAAPFTMEFRRDLVSEKWLPDLQQRAISITPGLQPIELLATDIDKASTSWPLIYYILDPEINPRFESTKLKWMASPNLVM